MTVSQAERKTETRRRLLEAAAELFAAEGIDAVSVDAVAEAAGRTSGALYAHFGSKQGLVLALLEDWSSEVLAVMDGAMAGAGDTEGRLAAVWRSLFGGLDGDGGDVGRLLLLEHELWLRAARRPEVAALVADRYAESRRRLARGFRRWMADGDILEGADADALAFALKAFVLGAEMQLRLDPGCVDQGAAVALLGALVGRRGAGGADGGADDDPATPPSGEPTTPTLPFSS